MRKLFTNLFSSKKSNNESSTTLEVSEDTYLDDSAQLVGYSNINEQILAYNSLLTFFNPAQTVLDINCGRGDLFAYIKQLHEDVFADSQYTGISTNNVLIDVGKEKYRTDNLLNLSFKDFTTTNKFNWVIASNYFNELVEDNYQNLYDNVEKMYKLSNYGVAFNLITSQIEDNSELSSQYHLYDSGKVFNHLLTTYKKVVVRADYLLGDITFFLFKN